MSTTATTSRKSTSRKSNASSTKETTAMNTPEIAEANSFSFEILATPPRAERAARKTNPFVSFSTKTSQLRFNVAATRLLGDARFIVAGKAGDGGFVIQALPEKSMAQARALVRTPNNYSATCMLRSLVMNQEFTQGASRYGLESIENAPDGVFRLVPMPTADKS